MLAVWYPIELLKGAAGTRDVYAVILLAILFVGAVWRILRR